MQTTTRHPGVLVGVILWTTGAGLLPLLSAPCLADVAPESGLFAHVQPVSGSCETPITECTQIVRSTSAEGPVEFLLFFMRGAYSWPGETICIQSIHSQLTWPETWQLVEFQACGSATTSWLDPNGSTHALNIGWYTDPYLISDLQGGVVPVARLVMNVSGPGRLDFAGYDTQTPIELRHGCYSSQFVTYPARVYAEAGIQCGYITWNCGHGAEGFECEPFFAVPELLLSTPTGTQTIGTVDFWAAPWLGSDNLCPVAIDTRAPWCTAWVDPVHEPGQAHLQVMADAGGLTPGLYETEIELSNATWGVARCLPVEFTVEEASASIDENPPETPTMNWGQIKRLYR
jgi:hypothetical protein